MLITLNQFDLSFYKLLKVLFYSYTMLYFQHFMIESLYVFI